MNHLWTKHTDTACNGDLWWTLTLFLWNKYYSSFKSGDFDISKDDFSFDYVREPGYKEELKLKELLDDNKSNNNEEGNDVNSSRQFSLLYSLVR